MSDDFVDAPTPDAPSADPITAPEPPEGFMWPFNLGTPITVPNKPDKVGQIKIRKPTGRDILEVGNPVILDPGHNPPQITHHPGKMAQMIFRLTDIPPPVQATMSPTDLIGLWWHITPFFIPGMG